MADCMDFCFSSHRRVLLGLSPKHEAWWGKTGVGVLVIRCLNTRTS
jgi:hypothetical protein